MRLADVIGFDRTVDPSAVRVVSALVVAEFLQGIGASAVLPLLPLYLRDNGTSTAVVGIVMSSFFVAGVLTQYASGYVSDRIGHRSVILLGLVIYAAASVAFILPVGAGGYVGLRGLQGVGAGAVQVAGLALVGVVVPLAHRGRAFSAVYAAQLAGMAIGPLAGSLAGVDNLSWLFVATAIASLAAAAPVVMQAPRRTHARRAVVTPRLHVSRALVGVALVAVIGGLVTGVYEACWSLLMHSKGAAAWQIGASWTLFALPFAAFSPVAGRLADRFNRRLLALFGTIATCAFAVAYPFLPAVWLLMVLGTLEAVGVAVAFPAAQSMLSETAPPEALGRAQGVFTTAQTAAIAVAAGASGAMFGEAEWIPFVVAASVGTALTCALPALWRSMPAHATGTARLPVPGPAETAAAGALPGAAAPD